MIIIARAVWGAAIRLRVVSCIRVRILSYQLVQGLNSQRPLALFLQRLGLQLQSVGGFCCFSGIGLQQSRKLGLRHLDYPDPAKFHRYEIEKWPSPCRQNTQGNRDTLQGQIRIPRKLVAGGVLEQPKRGYTSRRSTRFLRGRGRRRRCLNDLDRAFQVYDSTTSLSAAGATTGAQTTSTENKVNMPGKLIPWKFMTGASFSLEPNRTSTANQRKFTTRPTSPSYVSLPLGIAVQQDRMEKSPVPIRRQRAARAL